MDINSRDLVRHNLLLAGSGERAGTTLTRVTGYRRFHKGNNDAHLFAQSRTLRIRHFNGLDFSIESFDLAAPSRDHLTLRAIFMRFRGPQALKDISR